MSEIEREELASITGGETVTGTLVSALTTGIKALFDIGKSLGSSIRRLSTDNICPL